MFKFFTFLLLSCISFSAYTNELLLPIVSITDGDSIRTQLSLPCPLCNVSIRILGIDTPETSYLAKCPKEKELGIAAKEALKQIAAGPGIMIVKNIKWDKYGGRINGDVFVGGVNAGEELIRLGLARPYTGSGPKSDWCN